ncbi:pre-mRNA-processing protein 40B-like [Capsicum annuum]|uniref:pre-mRNA-processing protein 40B-like n=1 Tax=Capsicum annuum TaxID=4072 RepID=UPI001FB09B39|nr:pre-mRNA-processing protein 40B-like [Capsicum annuum]
MRAVINDRRYGALKSLCERKQAFNEYLIQKKKLEAEERRVKQKKAWEDFRIMLEDCKEMSPSSRWRQSPYSNIMNVLKLLSELKTMSTFLKIMWRNLRKRSMRRHWSSRSAIEWRDRTSIVPLLLTSFVQASSQWRKVQDCLETDERCSRLEKIDRLEIFQEYIRDLESEVEEQRKLRMEELRKAERKNRDEFRKLIEEHVAAGILNAKTNWRDYCIKIKDFAAYLAVSSNTSGSTARETREIGC